MPSVIRTVASLRSARAWTGKRWGPVGTFAIAGAAFVGVAYVVLKLAPDWFAETRGLEARDRADARRGVRTAALALLGGALAVVGSVYTARTFALNHAGQITDRFTKAIEQLGHTAIDVRLGGIYALERIAKDSKHDHPQIVEVLTAYVREHAPRSRAHEHERAERDVTPETPEEPARLATDVQAALTVLGRRAVEHEQDLPPALDLAATRLRRAELGNADLGRARFFEADLSEAFLIDANLSRASLSKANLSGANLRRANLSGAKLSKADLSGAFLIESDLSGAALDETDLSGAFLMRSDLSGANLKEANLRGTGLIAAKLHAANLSGADLSGAHLGEADLSSTYLGGANLSDANLRRANLSKAVLTDANLSEANLRGATIDGARWPEGFDAAAAVREAEEEPTSSGGSWREHLGEPARDGDWRSDPDRPAA